MATTELSGPVRVRFAPSPTGYLHVGGARTAIYNELLRQSLGGAFILRIEDTDRERSDEAMTRQIIDALAWIGIELDEGPLLQSARVERHRERAGELLASGAAYRCFCTPEELAEQRAAAEAKGEKFRYPRTCLPRAGAESDGLAAEGKPFVLRLRMPDEPIRVDDMVRGTVEVPPEALDDFVLLRSDGSPTYHLSVVVDDVDMEVTHVLRGEDHLSNTPKHVALFRALGAGLPRFGHLPLILGPDKKRLSKRTGATSVEELRDQGILPQALYNYLALLGWSPGDDVELMSREEMIERFSVERLNGSAAVFDRDKLAWMNAQYLMHLPLDELMPHLVPFLTKAGLAGTHEMEVEKERLRRAVELHRMRAKTLAELAEQLVLLLPRTARLRRHGVREVHRRPGAAGPPGGAARPLHPGGAVRGRLPGPDAARAGGGDRGEGGVSHPPAAHGALGREGRPGGLRPGRGPGPRGDAAAPHAVHRVAARAAAGGGGVGRAMAAVKGGGEVVGTQGFEPRFYGPEPYVLPLDDVPTG